MAICNYRGSRQFAIQRLLILGIFSFFSISISGSGFSPHTEVKVKDIRSTPCPVQDVHALWDVILQIYVSLNGLVEYKALQLAKSDLDRYLDALDGSVPDDGCSKDDMLAYWINAYNAFTIKLVLDHYPVSSIKEIYGGKPFDEKFISLGGMNYSLNQIEKEIIFGTSDDPRLHFALNCAAKSSPPLYHKAYRGSTLDKQLELVAHKFVNESAFNTITNNKIEISRIFDWYKQDFSNLKDFLYRYAMVELPSGVGIRFKDYDWSLNEKK